MEEKIKISEEKILQFIKNNSKRKETILNQYKDLIIRLLKEEIPKKKIYEFILDNDNSIGTQINFYKYIDRNINIKTSITEPKEPKQLKDKSKTVIIKPEPQTKSAKDILSQNFDLLEFPK